MGRLPDSVTTGYRHKFYSARVCTEQMQKEESPTSTEPAEIRLLFSRAPVFGLGREVGSDELLALRRGSSRFFKLPSGTAGARRNELALFQAQFKPTRCAFESPFDGRR